MNVNTVHTIFGAGAVGTELARQLVAKQLKVRLVSRSGTRVEGAETIVADASIPAEARKAAEGSTVIYNCSNAPYAKWSTELRPLFDSILATAVEAKADCVMLDNLYAYGPTASPMTEKTPELGTGTKGPIRRDLANEAIETHNRGLIRTAVVRASDFYGPGVVNAHLAARVWDPLFAIKTVDWVGSPDKNHSMAYVPDVARAMASIGTESRGFGQKWILPHAPAITPRELMALALEGTHKSPKIRGVNNTMLSILGLFMPLMKELKETYYMFADDYVVDSSAFEKEFGWQAVSSREGILETTKSYR